MRLKTLMQMLRFRRPMGSRTEQNFRNYFIHSLPDSWEDEHRNIHVLISRKDGSWPSTMWSCHTDTVHRDGGFQHVQLRSGVVALAPGERSNCLGADCTIGVWIMREMILAGVPGHYVFHWGEERGCIGSRAVVKDHPKYFRKAKAIIAFDRRGDSDVVTHQRGRRTASDAFADSLAVMLPKGYTKAHGIYTDSAEYDEIIPECTNLSVGYDSEHHADESVDLGVVSKLLRAMMTFDEDRLVIARDPSVKEEPEWMKRQREAVKSGRVIYYGQRPDYQRLPEPPPESLPPKPYVKGETYTIWKDGQLIQFASEQARMEAWLQQRAEEDEKKLALAQAAWYE